MGYHVITGGGSGIGRALAWELAGRGEQVLVIGRRENVLSETQAMSPELIESCVCDVTDEQHYAKIKTKVTGRTIQSLTHSAGVIDPIIPVNQISRPAWKRAFAVNLDAPLFLSQYLYPHLQGGRVLHVSTGAAHNPLPSWSAYCSSKAALSMLYRCWNEDQSEVAFGSVLPGIVETDMQSVIRDSTTMPAQRHDFFVELKKNNQLLKVETVAKFLTWLLLDSDIEQYRQDEWDIYEKSHHDNWLPSDHHVPELF